MFKKKVIGSLVCLTLSVIHADDSLWVKNSTSYTITIRPVTGKDFMSESEQTIAPGQSGHWWGKFTTQSSSDAAQWPFPASNDGGTYHLDMDTSWTGNGAWITALKPYYPRTWTDFALNTLGAIQVGYGIKSKDFHGPRTVEITWNSEMNGPAFK